MTASSSTSGAYPEDSRRVPGWLLLCVWVMIFAICLLQISLSERPGEWQMVVLDWGSWLIVAPLVIWLSARWPIGRKTWRWTVPVHMGLSLAVTVALAALAWKSTAARLRSIPPLMEFAAPVPPREGEAQEPASDFTGMPRPAGSYAGPGREGLIVYPRRAPLLFMLFTRGRGSVFFYWALLGMTHAVTYHRRSENRERRALAAEARLAEARLTALQAQLQPHFLFNTLNTISALVHEKPAAADEMICSLSDLLRQVLAVSACREVALAEEVRMARSYVAIQRVRFSDFLNVRWEIPEELGTLAVPPFLLQPLVENAVVHAVEQGNCPCTITLRAARNATRLSLDVINTNSSHAPRPNCSRGSGIGLLNTKSRLRELYGSEHVFEFALDPGGGASVHIEVPCRPIASEHEHPDCR